MITCKHLENGFEYLENNKGGEVTLRLRDTPESLKLWPYHFELHLNVGVCDNLTIELTTTNTDTKTFSISQALHSYFNISDITKISITGLDTKPYFDALTKQLCVQHGEITFNQEVDCVYQELNAPIIIKDENRNITITNQNSTSVIVWNPWIEKCTQMSGMNPDSYKTMVCVESANVLEDSKIILPNQSHTLKTIIHTN